jgi:hypothetical protein
LIGWALLPRLGGFNPCVVGLDDDEAGFVDFQEDEVVKHVVLQVSE